MGFYLFSLVCFSFSEISSPQKTLSSEKLYCACVHKFLFFQSLFNLFVSPSLNLNPSLNLALLPVIRNPASAISGNCGKALKCDYPLYVYIFRLAWKKKKLPTKPITSSNSFTKWSLFGGKKSLWTWKLS